MRAGTVGDQTACKPGSVPPGVNRTRRPFLWTAHCWTVLATYPNGSGGEPCPGLLRDAPFLFGLAPGGACHAASIAGDAVRSYRTLSPLPQAGTNPDRGGLLSVALSLGSPPAGVTRRLFAVEPGLSSLRRKAKSDRPAVWSIFNVRTWRGGVKRGKIQPRRHEGHQGAAERLVLLRDLRELCGESLCQAAARRIAIRRARVSPSATPSTWDGRQWRWKAVTMVAVCWSKRPEGALS